MTNGLERGTARKLSWAGLGWAGQGRAGQGRAALDGWGRKAGRKEEKSDSDRHARGEARQLVDTLLQTQMLLYAGDHAQSLPKWRQGDASLPLVAFPCCLVAPPTACDPNAHWDGKLF